MLPLHQWANLRLRTKGLIVVAFPAAATVAIACAAYWIGSLAQAAQASANHSVEILEEIRNLKTSDIETSASTRAYFLTRDESFAERAREHIASFDNARQRLVVLVADNPDLERRLAEIARMERSRMERIFAAITRFRAGILPASALANALRAGEAERLDMEKLIGAMLAEVRQLRSTQDLLVEVLRSRMRTIIGGCAFFGVVGGLVISLLFGSGITARIGRLEANVARLATGGHLDPGPEGNDEIGRLSHGVALTAQRLREKAIALENSLDGIAHVDGSGRYLSLNKACGEMLGLSGHSGGDIWSCIHPEDKSPVEQAMARVEADGRSEVEARVLGANGSVVDVAMTFLRVTSDGKYYAFMKDVSLQRQSQAALIRAKDAALASSRAKTEFLAKISHDIRTPLNAILGAADLLSQTPLDSDQREYVSMFQRNCRRLVALINDFLDFSRIEAGAVRLEHVSFRVRQIVDDTVRTFHESAARKRIALNSSFSPDVPDWISGDPLRIQQVLTNLLSNALKFTSEGMVDVRVQVTSAELARYLRFEVADTGPGIPAADQENIFAAFTQLPNQGATQIRGSGLGLTICRELVQLMGGEISVSSQPGSGSSFHFTIPLECALPDQPAPACVEPAASRLSSVAPLRILIAEDTEDNRILLQHYLRGQSVSMEFARTGQQVVDAFQNGEFALILMDIDMPEMDGRTATRRIRELEAAQGRQPTPIVALSAHAIQEEVRACLEAGCTAHIAKPVDQATLIDAMTRYARMPHSPGRARHSAIPREIAALVPEYLASKTRQIEEALRHLAQHEFEPVQRFGHNLKGTGRGYGFPEFEDVGRALEKAAGEEDEASAAGSLLALHRLVSEANLSRA